MASRTPSSLFIFAFYLAKRQQDSVSECCACEWEVEFATIFVAHTYYILILNPTGRQVIIIFPHPRLPLPSSVLYSFIWQCVRVCVCVCVRLRVLKNFIQRRQTKRSDFDDDYEETETKSKDEAKINTALPNSHRTISIWHPRSFSNPHSPCRCQSVSPSSTQPLSLPLSLGR